MLRALTELVAEAGGVALPETLLDAARAALDYARAADAAARRRVLASVVLDLPPWTDPILFDVSGGVGFLDLANQDYSITADVALGYNGLGWGTIGRGSFMTYQLKEEGGTSRDRDRSYGELEGWLVAGGGALRFDGRLVLGGGYYRTTDLLTETDVSLSAEASYIGRGVTLFGVRVQGARYAFGVWAGGGAQLEVFNGLVAPTDDDAAVLETDRQEFTANLDGRLRGRVTLAPQVLSLRLWADVDWFQLSVATQEQSLSKVEEVRVQEAEQRWQLELVARLFLDLDALAFFGFTPGLGAGVDLVRVEGEGGAAQSVAPVVTAGFRQEVF